MFEEFIIMFLLMLSIICWGGGVFIIVFSITRMRTFLGILIFTLGSVSMFIFIWCMLGHIGPIESLIHFDWGKIGNALFATAGFVAGSIVAIVIVLSGMIIQKKKK